MSLPQVKIKIENGDDGEVIKGSLGLLASYACSSSSDISDEECENYAHPSGTRQMLNDKFKNNVVEPVVLVENPLHENVPEKDTQILKQEPSDADDESRCDKYLNTSSLRVGSDEQNQIQQKPEDDHRPDFATVNGELRVNTTNLELKVDDFFAGDELYSEARKIKTEIDSGTSDSETDSEDTLSSESEDDIEICGDQGQLGKSKRKPEGPKVKGELTLHDLPLIENLHISVPRDECKPIGVVKSVVEPLVLVEALPETPALDLESVLFLEEGDRALGRIFDVIGQVKQPTYCVRFNSKEHIMENNVQVGMLVYCAPKTPYTTYVFLAQLRKLKGSDASWLNDIEPPVEEVEFSDDEIERIAKKKKKRNRKILKARATEEDALYKEDGDQSETQHRGKKRHHNFNGQQSNSTSAQCAPGNSSNAPFIPSFVPGFAPCGTPGYPGFPPSGNWFPGAHQMSQHREFQNTRGGRGFQRFRLPFPEQPPGYYNGFQRPPFEAYMSPWQPPAQWQTPNMANFNFEGNLRNPYPCPNIPYGFSLPYTPPPPPPPPPPPGL